jgi:hypothetical protein
MADAKTHTFNAFELKSTAVDVQSGETVLQFALADGDTLIVTTKKDTAVGIYRALGLTQIEQAARRAH